MTAIIKGETTFQQILKYHEIFLPVIVSISFSNLSRENLGDNLGYVYEEGTVFFKIGKILLRRNISRTQKLVRTF